MINKAGKFISGGIIAGASLLTKGIEYITYYKEI